MLGDLLRSRQERIGDRWFELTLATYRSDAAQFMTAQKNPFANPVGRHLDEDLRAVLSALLDDAAPEIICGHLEDIIKVRAIQEFTPAKAVCFVFLLKDAIRDVLGDEPQHREDLAALSDLETRIDQVALFAFDIFAKCREKVYSLRLNEIRKGYVQPSG